MTLPALYQLKRVDDAGLGRRDGAKGSRMTRLVVSGQVGQAFPGLLISAIVTAGFDGHPPWPSWTSASPRWRPRPGRSRERMMTRTSPPGMRPTGRSAPTRAGSGPAPRRCCGGWRVLADCPGSTRRIATKVFGIGRRIATKAYGHLQGVC